MQGGYKQFFLGVLVEFVAGVLVMIGFTGSEMISTYFSTGFVLPLRVLAVLIGVYLGYKGVNLVIGTYGNSDEGTERTKLQKLLRFVEVLLDWV